MRSERASSSELREDVVVMVWVFLPGEDGGGAYCRCACWEGRVTVVVVTVLVFCDWTLTLKFGLLVEWTSCFVVEAASACSSLVRLGALRYGLENGRLTFFWYNWVPSRSFSSLTVRCSKRASNVRAAMLEGYLSETQERSNYTQT